jgi:nicotinate-nucleotide adenylyltransferase
MPRLTFPPHAPRMRIGLMGGSFNPAHAAHRLVALTALKRLNLHAVWWLVSPGNPLKDHTELAPLATRIAQAQQTANHPRIHATGVEAQLGTRYTIDTVRALKKRFPHTHFVWVMGADNLPSFHRWKRWDALARDIPIAAIDRPHSTLAPISSRFGQRFKPNRLPDHAARALPATHPPAWVFLSTRRSELSSTRLRKNLKING